MNLNEIQLDRLARIDFETSCRDDFGHGYEWIGSIDDTAILYLYDQECEAALYPDGRILLDPPLYAEEATNASQ